MRSNSFAAATIHRGTRRGLLERVLPPRAPFPPHLSLQLLRTRAVRWEFSCWIYFLAVRTWPEELGWQGWGFHDRRSPALHECGACHLAAPLSPAARRMYRDGKDKRREAKSSRSLRAALLPAELAPAATSESVRGPQPPLPDWPS